MAPIGNDMQQCSARSLSRGASARGGAIPAGISSPVRHARSASVAQRPDAMARVPQDRILGRATVTRDTDIALGYSNKYGKGAVQGGLFQLSGAVNRTHSEPYIRTQPHGWHAQRYKNELLYSNYLEQARKHQIICNPAITFHAGTEKEKERRYPVLTQPVHALPTTLRPHDPLHHQWYHHVSRLGNFEQTGVVKSCNPTDIDVMTKSRDHIGYGNGSVGRGDIQETAVSRQAPSWFVGLRMVKGPHGVHRHPPVAIKDGKLRMNRRKYSKGPNMSIIEKQHWVDSMDPHVTPRNREVEKPMFFTLRDYQRNVQNGYDCVHGHKMCSRQPCENHQTDTYSQMTGGCDVFKQPIFPMSDYVQVDPPKPVLPLKPAQFSLG